HDTTARFVVFVSGVAGSTTVAESTANSGISRHDSSAHPIAVYSRQMITDANIRWRLAPTKSFAEGYMPNTGIKLIVVGLLLFSTAKSVYAQNRDILQIDADVISLSQQVKLLQSSVNQNNAVLKELVGKIVNQVNNVAASLQKLGQAINSLATHGNNTAGEVHLQLTNLSNHVNELQNELSAIQAQIGSVSEQITASKTTLEPLPGPEGLMRGAAGDALARNYDLAVCGDKEFFMKDPCSPRALHAPLAPT